MKIRQKTGKKFIKLAFIYIIKNDGGINISNKVVCCIYIDGELKRKAHLVGINISKATENYLRILLGQLSNIDLSSVKPEETKVQKTIQEPQPKK